MNETPVCPGTLADGFSTYSAAAIRQVFDGRSVSHLLPFASPKTSEATLEAFLENRSRISVPGYQEKLSLIQVKNKLRLTEPGEQGTHILKPIPQHLKKADWAPANEHLTMQIARQVFNIKTAGNALVFFQDGIPAYITRRFDLKPDGSKWGKEDFASLAGKTSDNAGSNFKYDFSYEELAALIRRFVPAWKIEVERFFTLILFNYLFSNGDAHLKNFALIETESGDHLLSPAYDLINTRIHVDDSDFALTRGLFADDFKSETFKKQNHASLDDFKEFARRIGLTDSRFEALLKPFLEKSALLHELIQRSFLPDPAKRGYLLHYQTRRNFLFQSNRG